MIRLLGKCGGIATGKAYMKLSGMDCGGFRLPIKMGAPSGLSCLKKRLRSLGSIVSNLFNTVKKSS